MSISIPASTKNQIHAHKIQILRLAQIKRSHARYRIIQCALATLIPEHRRSDRARELVVARSAERNQCK